MSRAFSSSKDFATHLRTNEELANRAHSRSMVIRRATIKSPGSLRRFRLLTIYEREFGPWRDPYFYAEDYNDEDN